MSGEEKTPTSAIYELLDELLAFEDDGARAALLRRNGLLDSAGLDAIIDAADDLLGSDPGKAGELAGICIRLSEAADAPEAVPKANYVLAGTRNIRGEFGEDLRLTQEAHDVYVRLGMHEEALRTNVGKMAALLELGRYREALETGRSVLGTLDTNEEEISEEKRKLLAALVHQNLGISYEYMGLYDEALAAYANAESLYEALGMPERTGEILDNRGAVLSSLGRSREALSAHEEAARLFEINGLTLSYTKALVNAGEAHLRLGNYRASLDVFERARPLLDSLDAQADGYLFLRHTADAYLELNLYSEALASYREADISLERVGMLHDRAQVLLGMGTALTARAEFDEAARMFAASEELFSRAGNTPMLSGVMLEQSALLAATGEQEAAKKRAAEALELLSSEDLPIQTTHAHLRNLDLSLPDDLESAEHHLERAKTASSGIALPQLRHRLLEREGRLRRLQGRGAEAEAALLEAAGEIERLRGFVDRDAARASFLRDKTAVYDELLLLYLERTDEDVAEAAKLAFEVSERAKSRALVDLLTGVVEVGREVASDDGLAAAHADLNAVYNQMLAGPNPTGTATGTAAELSERALRLEEEISRLRLRDSGRDTTQHNPSDPFSGSPSGEGLRDSVPEGVTLVAFHVVAGEVFAFCVSGGGVEVVKNLCSVAGITPLLRKLESQWDRFRAGATFSERHAATLERSTRRILRSLYDELLRPLEGCLPAKENPDNAPKLVIVPHAELHQVPFHALFDGERYVLEDYEVSYAPSVRVFSLCQSRETISPESILAVGVEDPLIPAARHEAATVAEVFQRSSVLTDEAAKLSALGSASGFGVVHLACHGMFRSDNPMFSSLKLDDGWLMAADAMNLDLEGAMVTLSACESGRNVVVGGDEILGLTRAFLGAKAATLLVSLWIVNDDTTAPLMRRYYEAVISGKSPATAIREAQLAARRDHPHPYYWAPFVIIGGR